MKHVASLRYGVVLKKAFCAPEIFAAFIQDMLGLDLEIEQVEIEKEFDPPIGYVAPRFDLFAEDKKHRVIVDIQHAVLIIMTVFFSIIMPRCWNRSQIQKITIRH